MAISHVCLNCGCDMARVRAQRDAEYGLWVVHCPRCDTCCVRNPNQIGRTWHRTLRIDMALSILLVQVLGVLLVATIDVVALTVASKLFNEAAHGLWGDEHTAMAIFVLLAAIGTGVWMSSAFGHVARWKMWLGWSAALVVLFAMFGSLEHGTLSVSWPHRGESLGEWMARNALALQVALLYAAVFMTAAGLGILPGQWLRAGHRVFRRWRWRMRRKRRRQWMVRV